MFSSDDIDKVAYFGHWADGTSHQRLIRDAVSTLSDAVLRCANEDARSEEVSHALRFLERHMTRPEHCTRFRQNLEIRDPVLRAMAARETLAALIRTLSPN
jgi:hypothetical protein